MYQRLPSWVLGFHGTDAATAQRILNTTQEHLSPSNNAFDWLGDGIYFWENDPVRALQYVQENFERKKKSATPAVIGAVIDLGLCLNLFDQTAIQELAQAYQVLTDNFKAMESPLPENRGGGEDRLLRYLDRAVITELHELRRESRLPSYDAVRSGFHEGASVYPGAGFRSKNHIQIAVRNPALIKGYFLPRL